MRTIIILIIISAAGFVFMSSCRGCHGHVRSGKKGNGHITTEERAVTPFTKISVEGVFPVELSQNGGKEFVKVETDENLQDMVEVKMDGDKLVITVGEKHIESLNSKAKIFINVKDLRELEFKSVGSITTANALKLDSLQLTSESVGKIHMELEANYLHADLNGIGETTLKGKTHEARINNKGLGAFHAFDLKSANLMIHNTGIGVTEVYADSSFYIRSSSIGALYYKGPGVIKELTSEGIGRVQKKD
ncbi:MAG: hypothetical protein JWO06_2532 [Bacteroidota bacterium]|nr:hypothetical protein [Bacteroidota bacterium]